MHKSCYSGAFSVVVPLFNKEEAIERAIRSVLAQSCPPKELIVVDDGSSDMSLEVAQRALSFADGRVECRLIAQKNAGVSAARNRGAEESRSCYIAFLDADDEWLPGYVAELEKLATAFPEASVLTVRNAKANSDGQVIPEPSPLPIGYFGILERPLDVYRRGYGVIHSSSIAVRKDAWERSGGFPLGARKSQDMFLWLKLCMAETFAHSGNPQSVWHDDYSGISRRKGVVPYHFAYFLGTPEGRRYLENDDLVKFLGSNLAVHIGAHRLNQDPKVAAELRQLSRVLPFGARTKARIASALPCCCLRMLAWVRRRSRGLRR